MGDSSSLHPCVPLLVYCQHLLTNTHTHAHKPGLTGHLFTSHWSMTGNGKSSGARCNYSGIYESEAKEMSPLTPWLPPYFACTRTKALSNAKKHEQTMTKPHCNKRKVVLNTGDATTVGRPPVTPCCATEKFKLHNSNAARWGEWEKKKGISRLFVQLQIMQRNTNHLEQFA